MGTATAILSIVTQWTLILATFVIVTHCLAIFWPRKPLKVPTDEEGRPVLWRNETEEAKDVACIWWGDSDEASAEAAAPERSQPITAFRNAAGPLHELSREHRRSVA